MKDIILGILFAAILLVAVGAGWAARSYLGAKDSYDAFKAGYLCGEAEAAQDWDTIDGQVYDCIVLEDGVWTWAMFPDCDEESK